MPTIALCPGCGAPLSETSVLALAPVCSHCKAVVVQVGGTLGFTGAYGVGDPVITGLRVRGDLEVLRGHQLRLRGMLEACKQQLEWGTDRYAKLPSPPQLHSIKPMPPVGDAIGLAASLAAGWFIGGAIFLSLVGAVLEILSEFGLWGNWRDPNSFVYFYKHVLFDILWWGGTSIGAVGPFIPHILVIKANGDLPSENARLESEYQQAVAHAMRAAEPAKLAEDHRLRLQIRQLEADIETVAAVEKRIRHDFAGWA